MSEFFKLVIVTLSDAEQALMEKWKVIYDDFIDSIMLTYSPKNSDSTQSSDSAKLKRQTLLSIKSPLRHGKYSCTFSFNDGKAVRPPCVGGPMTDRRSDA